MDADEKNNVWGVKKDAAPVLSSAELDKYLGVYSTTQMALKITVTKEGNVLMAEATGQDAFGLKNTGKDKFSFEEAGIEVEFDVTKNTLTLKQGGGSYVFTKEK